MHLVAAIADADVAHANPFVCAKNAGIAERGDSASGSNLSAGNKFHEECSVIGFRQESDMLVAMRHPNLTVPIIMTLTVTSATSGILVHGHRGARSVLPENTLPAFEYAIQAGADFLELDLAVTKDNVPVVSHDPVLKEEICTGGKSTRVIREMTLEQVRKWDCGALKNAAFSRQKPVPGTRIPTLEEVLALAPKGKFHFNIELKMSPETPQYTPAPEEFVRLVVDLVRKHKLESRTLIQSFDFRATRAAKALAPEIPRAALYTGKPRDLVAMVREAEATKASPHFSLVTKEAVEKLHAEGFPIVPWTPNEPAEWDRLIAAGVDEIITDDPAALIAHLKKRRLR
jgi:glycerophosphoryl diester phosphodiesterase